MGVPGSGKTTLKKSFMAHATAHTYEYGGACPRKARFKLKLGAYAMYPRLVHVARALQADGWVKHARCKEYLSWASTEYIRSASDEHRLVVIDHGPTHVGIPFNFQPGGVKLRHRERFFASLEGVRPDVLVTLWGGHEDVVGRLRQRRKPRGKFDLMEKNQLLHLFKQYEDVLADVIKYYASYGVAVYELDAVKIGECSGSSASRIIHDIAGNSGND